MCIMITAKDESSINIKTGREVKASKAALSEEVIERCLDTLDIFKEIMQLHRRKTIRDVMRIARLTHFEEEEVVYKKGDIAQEIFLVLRGRVSICRPVY